MYLLLSKSFLNYSILADFMPLFWDSLTVLFILSYTEFLFHLKAFPDKKY